MPAAKGNISGEGVTAERCRAEELVEVGAAGGGAHIDTSSIPESPTNPNSPADPRSAAFRRRTADLQAAAAREGVEGGHRGSLEDSRVRGLFR